MANKHHFNVLRNSYGMKELMEHGKKSGVKWEEHKDEGVNWFRFSNALSRHLENGGDVSLDDTDRDTLVKMFNHYSQLLELHKKGMVPHVRAAMSKIKSEDTTTGKSHMDYLNAAYQHLDANGGPEWAEKVSTLRHIHGQLASLSGKLSKQ